MRIAVAGGRGFIGTHVVAAARRAGHDVVVSGREEPVPAAGAIVHLGLFSARDAEHATAGAIDPRARWVVASSGDVYRRYGWMAGTESDPGPPGPLAEDAPLRTRPYPYGRRARGPRGPLIDYDKILVERAVERVGAVVLRLPKVYGPGCAQPFGRWLERAAAGARMPVGERVADWCWTHGYVEDVAAAFVLAATAPGIDGRVYNVGESRSPTMRERLEALARAVGRDEAVEVVADDEVPPELRVPIVRVADMVYDTARLRGELGWHERIDEQEALRRTARAHLGTG